MWESNEILRHKMKITTSFQVKVLQKKFTLLHADFSKIVLKYSPLENQFFFTAEGLPFSNNFKW